MSVDRQIEALVAEAAAAFVEEGIVDTVVQMGLADLGYDLSALDTDIARHLAAQ